MVSLEYLLGFVKEDAPTGDVTSDAIVPDISCHAVIRAEQSGIIAGMEEAVALFGYFDVVVEERVKDGMWVNAGDVLLLLSGNAKKILLVERTALNIIGRMSGIATQTKTMVKEAVAVNPRCRIACTRKTCPGFRLLDKKAVMVGGGYPHRTSLSDGILIKDNHLALVPLDTAIRAAKQTSPDKPVEVEVETPKDALKAAKAGADIIMLDNMSPDQINEIIAVLKREGLREQVTIELSGGIDERSIHRYAPLEIDIISMGSLTHSVRNFSVNLEILP